MNFKAFLQKKGITDEAFGKMEATEQAKLHGEFLDEMAKAAEENGDKLKALDGVKELVDAQKATIDNLTETVKTQGEKLVEMTKGNGVAKATTLVELFKEKYDENVDKGNDDFRVLNGGFKIDTSKAQVSTDVMSVDTVNSTAFPTAGSTGVVTTALRSLYGKIIGFFGPRIPQSLSYL